MLKVNDPGIMWRDWLSLSKLLLEPLLCNIQYFTLSHGEGTWFDNNAVFIESAVVVVVNIIEVVL